MPELPEVETSRRGIEPHLVGATIMHATVRNGRLRWPVSEEIYRLSDKPVLSVQRRAKYLLLELPDGWVIIHLGMSGSLRILPEELPADKHDHVDLVMSNGKVLRYTDPRRFGAWLWTKELDGHNVLAHLGPEPLSDDFNAGYLQQKCAKKKTAIKPWLMDNKLVVGWETSMPASRCLRLVSILTVWHHRCRKMSVNCWYALSRRFCCVLSSRAGRR